MQFKLKILKYLSGFLVCGIAIGQILPTASIADDRCQKCNHELKELVQELATKEKLDKLMVQNRDFIVKHAAKFPKQAIIVKSNIVVLSIKTETASNNIEATIEDLKKKGCDGCQNEFLKKAGILPLPSTLPSTFPSLVPPR